MGNPLSPVLANIFMSFFERNLKNSVVFPRIWIRYVDDIFAVVKSRFVEKTLNFLNNQHTTIKFTHEQENDGKLPFLDVLTIRSENKINFKIYRKPTSTNRYISSKSFHSFQHKNAAFNSMAHRLTHIPLTDDNYLEERNNILNFGLKNGYEKLIVEKIIRKHEYKVNRANLTTLINSEQKEKISKRISIPYYPRITNKLATIFQKHKIHLVTHSNNFKIKNKLGSVKDKIDNNSKSGIYQISCATRGCDHKYIGQSRRAIKTRFTDHLRAFKNNHPENSAVANHMLLTNDEKKRRHHHHFTINNLELLQHVPDQRKLDFLETFHIQKNNSGTLMNQDQGPLDSPFFNIIL
jgi:hypothetical protein